jgi:hypothetical protein
MANKSTTHVELPEEYYEDDIGDDDYGFVFGPDGELKSVFLPSGIVMEPPKKIKKILKMFGIKDIDDIEGDVTIH